MCKDKNSKMLNKRSHKDNRKNKTKHKFLLVVKDNYNSHSRQDHLKSVLMILLIQFHTQPSTLLEEVFLKSTKQLCQLY